MIIYNAKINNMLKAVKIKNGKIVEILNNQKSGDINANGFNLIPGLIDIHTHGCCGTDAMDGDFKNLCRFYAQNGTTSFLPTTMTMDKNSLSKVTEADTKFYGANILGFHFEGPYISKEYKGAQKEEYIKNPSVEEFNELNKLNNIKMITVAPELKGSAEFIKEVSKNCIVSIGHTSCNYNEAVTAISLGAGCLTHIYNAMPEFCHRSPGPIGAAFTKKIYAQLICDGIHVLKPSVLATFKLFGSNKVILISDSIKPTGCKKGKFECGGLTVTLKNNIATLSNGTIAGSTSFLLNCVKKAIEFGVPFKYAVKAATENPAKLLKIKKGKIKEGFDADLLITDDNLNLKTVIINGEVFE